VGAVFEKNGKGGGEFQERKNEKKEALKKEYSSNKKKGRNVSFLLNHIFFAHSNIIVSFLYVVV